MIKIMKASAGSGKTFNLAKTYIRLLLGGSERYAYRHILAVTFTNKATEEMKSRILKELHVLAKTPEDSPYCMELLDSFNGSIEKLRSRAEMALCDILHDYGSFAVSTIDRFFQQTLRAFSREIGQFSTYQVELDKNSLVEESVDRLLDSLSESRPELLKWLTRSVMEDISQGNRYNLDKNLRDVALSLKSDAHRAAVEEYGICEQEAYSESRLEQVRKGLSKVIDSFRRDVRAAAKAFADAASDSGMSRDDFSRNSFDQIFNYALAGPKDEPKYPTDTIFKKSEDFDSWFRKADRCRFAFAGGRMLTLLQDYCALFGKRYEAYVTAGKIVGKISDLRIAGDLYREFDELMREKNVLSLDDSNLILKRIIDGSDAPFIYEKLGVRFEHFLLDEFQDTSRIQWDNFRPLLKESDSKGFENLLVGDVKQSIYRWRGSDWKMMAGEVQREFPLSEVRTLDSNYRSLRNIVEFNNGFFDFASARLDELLGEDAGGTVSGLYADEWQLVKVPDVACGSVEAVFCEEDEELGAVLETIGKVRAVGAKYGDVTVLVRNNVQGSEVAAYLMDKGISVISDDSLHLKSSSLVRQLVSLLSSVGDEDDTVGSFLAQELGIEVKEVSGISVPDLCEHLLRLLKDRNPETFDEQAGYLQSFMDVVQDHVSINGNSLDGFLKSWEGSEPKISSPTDPESVRVMTIHKSKGLEFPYVIFPYSEKTKLFRPGSHWAHPDVEGTELENVADGVYNVGFTKPQNDPSLFRSSSGREMRFQFIDNINTYYVALTRAVKGLTIISRNPSTKVMDAAEYGSGCEFKDFSEILYFYLKTGGGTGFECVGDDHGTSFFKGTLYDFSSMERKGSDADVILIGYPSYPLNPDASGDGTDVRERGRLRSGADAVDFFDDEARAAARARMNGTVLHDVLSRVIVPSDLGDAVRCALEAGELDEESAEMNLDMLRQRIASRPEWFPEDDGAEILTETSLIDTDGKEYRPDRVILRDGTVTIVDYKFGDKDRRYRSQLLRYADIYRRMGNQRVSASIWYVTTDEVEKI